MASVPHPLSSTFLLPPESRGKTFGDIGQEAKDGRENGEITLPHSYGNKSDFPSVLGPQLWKSLFKHSYLNLLLHCRAAKWSGKTDQSAVLPLLGVWLEEICKFMGISLFAHENLNIKMPLHRRKIKIYLYAPLEKNPEERKHNPTMTIHETALYWISPSVHKVCIVCSEWELALWGLQQWHALPILCPGWIIFNTPFYFFAIKSQMTYDTPLQMWGSVGYLFHTKYCGLSPFSSLFEYTIGK